MKIGKISRIYLLALIAFAGTVACGSKPEGWGVMLWSLDESSFATGSVTPVTAVSLLNKTYDIQFGKDSPVVTVPQWRIEFFKRKAQAEEYASDYRNLSDFYAVAELNGLPVREEQDQDAKRVYKLRIGEIIKILDRDDQKSTAGEYEGYWYKVLTDGGVVGYVFDRYLAVYTKEELSSLEFSEEKDEFLDHFLATSFRPVYFRKMLVTRRVDLERFLPDYGIFPDPDNNRLTIVAEDHTTTIEYTGIEKGTEDSYAFVGSTLLMIVKSTYEVNLQYADGGVQYSEDYVRIDPDIDLLIITEIERRARKFEDFISRGNTLTSSVYGTITLAPGGGFQWDGFDRLVPDVIGAAAGNSGIVDFQLHVSSELASTYDGTVSFLFSGLETVHFLYTIQDQGVRFKLIQWDPESEDTLVEDEGNSPIVIFFHVTNTEEP